MAAAAIHEAARQGDLARVRELTDNDPDLIDAPDAHGQTPLMCAVLFGHDAVVMRLLQRGADLSVQDPRRGQTALHLACFRRDRRATLVLLLRAGAPPDARDAQGKTPLMHAARLADPGIAQQLLRYGADVGVHDPYGATALHLACFFNKAPCLALLLDAGACPHARTAEGHTPLITAAAQGSVDCLRLLLARVGGGALGLDAKCKLQRQTALHHALHKGLPAGVISLLLQAGAHPAVPDRHGEVPLDVAHERGQHEIMALLEAALAEPERARALLKARALLDAPHAVERARDDARDKEGLGPVGQQQAALTAAPAYLKERVAQGQQLPRVEIGNDEEKLVACVKYALGLEGGGGVVVEEGQDLGVGMTKGVFVELCEMLVPKWDRANV